MKNLKKNEVSFLKESSFHSDGSPTSVFGVFDGHGGDAAAAYCSDHLLEFLAVRCPNLPDLCLSNEAEQTVLRDAIVDSFRDLDNAFLTLAK